MLDTFIRGLNYFEGRSLFRSKISYVLTGTVWVFLNIEKKEILTYPHVWNRRLNV